MISEFEKLRIDKQQTSYDLESERNERRRLQQQVELTGRELQSVVVGKASYVEKCHLLQSYNRIDALLLWYCLMQMQMHMWSVEPPTKLFL